MDFKWILDPIIREKPHLIHKQLIRDLIKGAVGLVMNLLIIFMLVEYLNVTEELAPVVSLSLILFFAYIATDKYTFSEFDSPTSATGHIRLFFHFLGAYVSGQAVKYVIYLLILPFVPYLIGWPIASGSGFIISFAVSRRAWSAPVQ